jgi:hypothetical protein
LKRAVYDKIGGLDERFGLGFFDDDDLAERARRAGFELAVTHDLFVRHFGSQTFAGNGIDAGKLLEEMRSALRINGGSLGRTDGGFRCGRLSRPHHSTCHRSTVESILTLTAATSHPQGVALG